MPRTWVQGVGFVLGFWLAITVIFPLGARSEPAGDLTGVEAQIHDEVNAFREQNRLMPLTRRADLDAVARAHSEDMVRRGYFSHETPEGLNPMHRIQRAGIDGMTLAAENVGQTTERAPGSAILTGWKRSPDHYRNLVGRPFNHTGLGAARTPDGRLFVTQLYVTFPRR